MKLIKINLKQRWINYLKKLGKVNENLYGSQRLDCCDLDRKKKV